MPKKIKTKEKISSAGSIASSITSFFGGYQVCHNVCLGIIAFLSILGITITGMPLLFLQKVAVPFWIAAVVLLFITLILYLKKKCISRNLIILNTGVIIAGVPFSSVQDYSKIFWIIGGAVVLISITLFIKDRISRRK